MKLSSCCVLLTVNWLKVNIGNTLAHCCNMSTEQQSVQESKHNPLSTVLLCLLVALYNGMCNAAQASNERREQHQGLSSTWLLLLPEMAKT